MNLERLNEELKNKDLSKESILRLMNLKINNDMDKLISTIDKLEDKLDHKLEASIGSLKSETKIVYWVVGIAMASITILLGVIGLIFAFKK